MNTDLKATDTSKQTVGEDKDINLTDTGASLVGQPLKQPDAPSMTDNATSAASDNLTQSISGGSEINPEYGDSEDPTFETL